MGDFCDFSALNCNEVDGDRPGQPANRNCYRLSRVLWAVLKLLVVQIMLEYRLFLCFISQSVLLPCSNGEKSGSFMTNVEVLQLKLQKHAKWWHLRVCGDS